MRRSITSISPCDLTKEQPFDVSLAQEMLPLDCILSSLTLEVAAQDLSQYADLVSRLASWLRPGGHLILISTMRQNYYTIGSTMFYSLYIEPVFLRGALNKAGMEVVTERLVYFEDLGMNRDSLKDMCDGHGCIFIHACKRE